MKKQIALILLFMTAFLISQAQVVQIGIRVNPLNSYRYVDNAMSYSGSNVNGFDAEERFDSLNIGIFSEYFFEKQALLLRLDLSYADFNVTRVDNETFSSGGMQYTDNFQQTYKQKFLTINPGLGSRIHWSAFDIRFGVNFPITWLPKGTIDRKSSYITNGTLTSEGSGTGKYKAGCGFGIGSFAGISTTLLKHLTIGLDLSYSISYLKRDLDWYGETYNYYSGSSFMSFTNETVTERSFYTSRFIPSIMLAYTFNTKKVKPLPPNLVTR